MKNNIVFLNDKAINLWHIRRLNIILKNYTENEFGD